MMTKERVQVVNMYLVDLKRCPRLGLGGAGDGAGQRRGRQRHGALRGQGARRSEGPATRARALRTHLRGARAASTSPRLRPHRQFSIWLSSPFNTLPDDEISKNSSRGDS